MSFVRLKCLTFAIFTAAALFFNVSAQENVEDLQRKYQSELEKDYVKNLNWELDFDIAKKRAKDEKKAIIVFFTRSYAPCPPCERVEKELILSDEFIKYAKDKIIYLSITTKIPDRKYDYLLSKLNYSGFPTISILSEEGRVLADPDEVAVNCTVKSIDAAYKKAMEVVGIYGEEKAKIVAQMKKEFDEVQKKAKEYDEQAQFDLDVYKSILKMKKMAFEDVDSFEVFAKDFYDKYKNGKRTQLFHNNFRYYDLVLRYALEKKDVETSKEVVGNLEEASEEVKNRFPRQATDYNKYLRNLKNRVRAFDVKNNSESK